MEEEEGVGVSLSVLCANILYSSLTLYLQQYLCIFYEVIKINNVAHKLLAPLCFSTILQYHLADTFVQSNAQYKHELRLEDKP